MPSGTLLCIAATAALLVAELLDLRALKILAKACASLGFVLAAVQHGALGAGLAGLLLLVALALSVVGDLMLLSTDRRAFLGGLGAFLLAHVAFLATFLALGFQAIVAVGAAVSISGVASAVWRWLSPHVGSMREPVLAYLLVIAAMVAVSIGVAARHPAGTGPWVALAAVVFLISDLCVARDRFVAPGKGNRLLGLPLYYFAQVLFAWSVPPLSGG